MRGRTFINKFLIIDEAQNLTPKQMKTLITRAGPGTKVVCLGNIAQIDTPYLDRGQPRASPTSSIASRAGRTRARHADARRALAARRLRVGHPVGMPNAKGNALTQLGHRVAWPDSPDEACSSACRIRIPDKVYSRASLRPEFTSLCPVTGQPDFAHLVIDYVPRRWLVESKSLKLYLGSFRNHGAFHEDCTLAIAARLVGLPEAALAAHRRLLVSARRHADRRLLADRPTAGRPVDSRPGRRALRGGAERFLL